MMILTNTRVYSFLSHFLVECVINNMGIIGVVLNHYRDKSIVSVPKVEEVYEFDRGIMIKGKEFKETLQQNE